MRESCMHKIKRNTRGATMLIALLVFLIAALSGTIALTMAASNAGRYTHEKEDQQAYLSVISAGNLILDRLKGVEIEYAGKTQNKTPISVDEININYTGTGKQDLFLADDGFKKNLKTFSLYPTDWEIMEFYLKASEDSGMGKVCVSVSASGSLFSFRLYHVSGSARNYQMTLNVNAIFVENRYTKDEDDNFFKRHLTFITGSAEYVVERNA